MSVTIGKTEEKSRTDTQTRYIEAKLANSSRIKRIRDNIYEKFVASHKYRKIEPHITIIPPFTIPDDNVCDIHKAVSNLDLEETTVHINGLSVWPSLNNPRVILLDVEIDLNLEKYRESIQSTLETYEATLKYEPVNAHITLFKCDNGYDLAKDATKQLQELIWDNREGWDTSIKYIDIPDITECKNC